MNTLKRFRVEVDGIINTAANIANIDFKDMNAFTRLKKAVRYNDIEIITHCLQYLSEWYVINKFLFAEAHKQNKNSIDVFLAGFDGYQLTVWQRMERLFRMMGGWQNIIIVVILLSITVSIVLASLGQFTASTIHAIVALAGSITTLFRKKDGIESVPLKDEERYTFIREIRGGRIAYK
jgi:hypothetical protein